MVVPDPRYLPKAKNKKKVKKQRLVENNTAFPQIKKLPDFKANKKVSTLNDKHVWSS